MQDLKVTLIQADLAWEDVNANLAAFGRLIDTLADETDLIVLPEMFTTGFSMQAAALAEEMEGPTLAWLREKSARKHADVVGGAMMRSGEKYVNRLLWVKPDGQVLHYDKRHLLGIAGEDKVYTPGSRRLTVTLKGWRIRPFICYDLRFPAWVRNVDTPPYDLALFIANWPRPRVLHWKALLLARAIENQCYVIGVNRIGTDGNGNDHCGDSMVIDPLGNVLFQKRDFPALHTATLSQARLQAWRQQFNALGDADADLKI